MGERGYGGNVTLVSPKGERVKIYVPGRGRSWNGALSINCFYGVEKSERRDRQFRRLLSAGWKVEAQTAPKPVEAEDKVREEAKKNTDVVIGTAKTGDQSHGGEHASGEVPDSPNRATRGCRGGEKKRRQKENERRCNTKRLRLKVQNAGQRGGAGVYSPQPLRSSPQLLKAAERSAELLAELVGKAQIKTRRSITVNAEKLLVALEIGDNPLPPLEWPSERPKVRVLVTPDCSGSTQNWSGLGRAWALHLSRIPDTEVIYLENFNGEFWEVPPDGASRKLVESVDIVLYLGDSDGQELCHRYAGWGATVIALDCYAANAARPRMKAESVGSGTLFWVDRVSRHAPETWAGAIGLCVKVL